jgi:hypothetical protein
MYSQGCQNKAQATEAKMNKYNYIDQYNEKVIIGMAENICTPRS